jgi:hypothetical protein
MIYHIKKHYSQLTWPKLHFGNPKVNVMATFKDSCNYTFDNAPDRNAINKLIGFCFLYHHYHSYRIGWNVRDGRIQLFAYTYVNFIRLQTALLGDKFVFNVPIHCRIYMENEQVIFDVKQDGYDSGVFIQINPSVIKLFGYYLKPYVGGKSPAPHPMEIEITQP